MMNPRMSIKEETARCLLCHDAPCSKACPKGDPARALRAIRFGNEKMAMGSVASAVRILNKTHRSAFYSRNGQ
jgi:dihydropyrimidine dehydrogenase (NAD+) subunit PreA